MNLNEVRSTAKRGDTNLNNVTITMIRDTVQNGNGRSTRWRNFAIRKDNNYVNQVQNIVIEKQPLDLFCTTWELEIITALDHLKEGDKVNISAFLEPVWRGYKANNTLEGIRFIVPDTGQAPVQLPDGDVIQPDTHPYRLDKNVRNVIVYQGVTLNVVSLIPATTTKTELVDSTTPIGQQHMRNLETVWCCLHSRSQPRYPRFTLCDECSVETPYEAPIVEAVVNYFSKPQFRDFFIETEHEIQMGTDNRRPDIVLLDKSEGFVAIAECKQTGVVTYGREQLKSYLCATDTQFGVFANSTNPNEWEFYENLRRNQFTHPLERFDFERKIATGRTIESIREEKNKLDREIQKASDQYAQKTREVDSSCKQLDELNEEIERKNKQLAQLKKEIKPLRRENSDLKEEIVQHSQQAEVLRGLKLRSTRASLTKENNSLIERRAQLQYEIQKKEDQEEDLTGKIDTLKRDRIELEKQVRAIHIEYQEEIAERDKIHQEYRKYKPLSEYHKAIDTDLQRRIDHKTSAIRELDRRLDERKAACTQESIYGQLQKEFERLEELKSEIARKQQLARQDQERHAACERNKVETNQKMQQLIQTSQEKESILKQLRVVVNQLKTANLEQNSQIEVNRKQLVQDLRKHKCRCVQLTREISELKGIKSSLEEEIRQEGQQVLFEEGEAYPAYVKIQLEIDELKIEKSKIEAKIGHQIFLRLP